MAIKRGGTLSVIIKGCRFTVNASRCVHYVKLEYEVDTQEPFKAAVPPPMLNVVPQGDMFMFPTVMATYTNWSHPSSDVTSDAICSRYLYSSLNSDIINGDIEGS